MNTPDRNHRAMLYSVIASAVSLVLLMVVSVAYAAPKDAPADPQWSEETLRLQMVTETLNKALDVIRDVSTANQRLVMAQPAPAPAPAPPSLLSTTCTGWVTCGFGFLVRGIEKVGDMLDRNAAPIAAGYFNHKVGMRQVASNEKLAEYTRDSTMRLYDVFGNLVTTSGQTAQSLGNAPRTVITNSGDGNSFGAGNANYSPIINSQNPQITNPSFKQCTPRFGTTGVLVGYDCPSGP